MLTNFRFLRTSIRYYATTNIRLAKKSVVVPQLAESLSEGDIKFDKVIGDVVAEDDQLGAIETDKTSVPINSPFAGKIVEILVEDSSTVKPGQKIMVIDTDAAVEAATKPPPSGQAAAAPETALPPQQQQQQQQQKETKPVVTQETAAPKPALAQKTSSISVETVKRNLAESSAQGLADGGQARTTTSVKMNRMRQRIASRLKDAQNTYAMLTTFNEIDMSNIIEMRNKYKEDFLKRHNVKLGFMSAFVKASACALQEQPIVNAIIDENTILYRNFVDISVAVATPKGLVVPVIRNVEHMSFADIEKTISQLGEKAKKNELTVGDMEGGTFTISNGGVFGSLFGTPIINMPQSAILGMHAIKEKPVAVNGQVLIRPVMVVALTYDHRIIDGREAVTFLKKIVEIIEDPRRILLD